MARRHLTDFKLSFMVRTWSSSVRYYQGKRQATSIASQSATGFANGTCCARTAGALPEMTFNVVTNRETHLGGLANVRIHREVADETLAELYRTADTLLLPPTDSTANNALLEGIASGLPVVATDLPALRAYLPNCGAAFVPNNSVDAFFAALRSLRQHPSLRHMMGCAARARAAELAWPRLLLEYEALYTRVRARPAIGFNQSRGY